MQRLFLLVATVLIVLYLAFLFPFSTLLPAQASTFPSFSNSHVWVVTVAGHQYQVNLGKQSETTATAPPIAPDLSRLGSTERVAWALDFLNGIGNDQPTLETVAFVVAWQAGENTQAAFNPLATTQSAPGATCFNYIDGRCGVRNYTSREQGLQATVETIMNGYYANILQGLQSTDPNRALNADELGTWGTGLDNVQSNYNELLAGLKQPTSNKCPVTQPSMQINAHFSDTNSEYWAGQIGGMHNGTDIGGNPGTPVYAPYDLTVEDIQYYSDPGRIGWYVQGRFEDGYLFYSGHLGSTAVQVGQHVPACTQIGTIGEVYHSHIKIAPPEAPVPCEIYARTDGSPWCEDFEAYFASH